MRIEVVSRGGPHAFEVDDDRVVGTGNGPGPDRRIADVAAAARAAIGAPIEFPPLAQAIVPGAQVAIAADPATPGLAEILDALVAVLREVGAGSITVVATRPGPPLGPTEGVEWLVHDPDDRNLLAYLASTKDGNRVYLPRVLTDADLVIPIGTIEDDPALGHRGPWSTLFPELSDRATLDRFRSLSAKPAAPGEAADSTPGFREAAEVTWLLGSQFQVGVIPGADGPMQILAGLDAAVRDQGPAASDHAWARHFPDQADLVIAGVGAPGRPSTLADLARGLTGAVKAVRRGGKVALLAHVDDMPGPALLRLAAAQGSRAEVANLRGLDNEPDGAIARQVAAAVAWADVYLHANLDPDLVDNLGMIPLDRPADAGKLANRAGSVIAIGQADHGRVVIDGEPS